MDQTGMEYTTPQDMGQDVQTHITVKVQGMLQDEVHFRIRKSAPLSGLMRAYCDKMRLDDHAVRFTFDGKRVHARQTPSDLKMTDGDVIDAWVEQMGG